MDAFTAYKEKKYGDAADIYHAVAERMEGDEVRRAAVLCNAAAAEHAMELNRSCLKTCAAAIDSDPKCIKAYLIKGRALKALNKVKKAKEAWQAGLAAADESLEPWDDVEVFELLHRELNSDAPLGTLITATSTSPLSAAKTPFRISAAAQAASVRPPLSSSPPPPPSHAGETDNDALRMEAIAGPVAAAAAAAAEQVCRSMGVAQHQAFHGVTEPMLAAARKVLSHSSGVAALDGAIARGYLLVNTGLYAAASALFDVLLEKFPGLVAAQMAKGSACAMTGQFEGAVACFTEALRHDPSVADGWKRRGQVQAARGEPYLRAALQDLNQAKALDIQKSTRNNSRNSSSSSSSSSSSVIVKLNEVVVVADPDILHQRGSVLHRLKEFGEAVIEFDQFVKAEPENSIGWNYVGLCRAQLGDIQLAFSAYERASQIDRNFKEALVNLAQLKREAGEGLVSLKTFDLAFELDPSHAQTSYFRGLLKHGLGRPQDALLDFERAIQLGTSGSSSSGPGSSSSPPPPSQLVSALQMAGLCLQALGQFQAAERLHFDVLLEVHNKGHAVFYSRELGRYFSSKLDSSILHDATKTTTTTTTVPGNKGSEGARLLNSLEIWRKKQQQRTQQKQQQGKETVSPHPSPPLPTSPSSSLALADRVGSGCDDVVCVGACGWGHWSSDSEVDPYLKDAQCKRHDPHTHPLLRDYMMRNHHQRGGGGGRSCGSSSGSDGGGGGVVLESVSDSFRPPDVTVSLSNSSSPPSSSLTPSTTAPPEVVAWWGDRLGKAVLLNECKGFLDNERQVRQFGLAVLETSQLMRKHWANLKYGNGRSRVGRSGGGGGGVGRGGGSGDGGGKWCSPLGVMVPDAASSRGVEAVAALSAKKITAASASAATAAAAAAAAAADDDSDSKSPLPCGWHPLEWRDVFDCCVRWRQVSEPNDPVWWIDRLAPEAFNEGFGLQTPLVNGQLKVIRYYPYFPQAFELMKDLIIDMMAGQEGGVEAARAVRSMTTLEEIYEAWGKGDFWVVSPCESTAASVTHSDVVDTKPHRRIMEGTRLTVQRKEQPHGFEFTIRTPGTPERWVQYEEEFEHLFEKLNSLVLKHMKEQQDDDVDEEEGGDDVGDGRTTLPHGTLFPGYCNKEEEDGGVFLDEALDIILAIFFYWVNFGPLSRGSAACGYAVLCGLLAALNIQVTTPLLPPGKQLDWEAILRPNPQSFIAIAKPWLLPKLSHPSSGCQDEKGGGDVLGGAPDLSLALPTLRAAVEALNAKPAKGSR